MGSGISKCRTAEVANVVDQCCRGVQRLLQAHRIEHVGQTVMTVLQQAEQCCTRLQLAGRQQLIKKFQLMGEVANRGDFDHPRTALEGMQVAQQVVDLDTVARLGLPAQQGSPGAFYNVKALFEENLQQFLVAGILHWFCWLLNCHCRWRAMAKLTQCGQ
ncbi:hypothetical protein D3C78_620490 [compost metagenome]